MVWTTICCYSRSKIILCNKLFPKLNNSHDCGLFAIAVIWHLLEGKEIQLTCHQEITWFIQSIRLHLACELFIPGRFRAKGTAGRYYPQAGNCNLRHSCAAVTAAKDGRCLKKRSKEVIKQLANDVALHKHAPPTANDVIKAGVHKKKTLLSYKQCYRGVNARNDSKIISDPMSFQLVGPYVEAFAQRNPGSTAFMERGSDNRIQRVFVCPSFANDVLMCVRPVISIHMRSEWKGTLYLVKSAGEDLYPVAFAITVDGEDFQGWLWFLQHLKASAPNLIAEHFRRECSYKLFTFMSDRCKGLTTALGNVFPANHNCYCAVHIRRNVESNHGKKFASTVTALSETTSLPEKRALLTQLQQKSPGAYKYVMDIDANRWMDSAWLEDEKLPPRYGFRNSNISESANNMFHDARNGN
ncbi:MULE transposase domain containing protein [Nitzschia inconspicua]|uniref:MULE transposase domain containing protein n=1 Tax=Nitzschia inconspicua TaxID=303405 RepID=A0A9K3KZK6_9STRA|nr:MULE transposase domain containing protein [Nitzschia inconspicua]